MTDAEFQQSLIGIFTVMQSRGEEATIFVARAHVVDAQGNALTDITIEREETINDQ